MKRFMTWWAIVGMAMLNLPNLLWAEVRVPRTDTGKVENQVTDGKRTGAQQDVAHKKTLLQQAIQRRQQAPPGFVEENNFDAAFNRFIRENWGDPTRRGLGGIAARRAASEIRPKLEGLMRTMSIFGGVQIGKSSETSKDIVFVFKGVLPIGLRPAGEAPTYYGSMSVVIETRL